MLATPFFSSCSVPFFSSVVHPWPDNVNSYLSLPVIRNIPPSITPSQLFLFVFFKLLLLPTLSMALVTDKSATASQPKLVQFFCSNIRDFVIFISSTGETLPISRNLFSCSVQCTSSMHIAVFLCGEKCAVCCVFAVCFSPVGSAVFAECDDSKLELDWRWNVR